MASAGAAMTMPIIEVVIRDGVPVFRVEGLGMVSEHQQLWQARIRWECMAVATGYQEQEPVVVDGDGGRFGEGGL